MIKNCPTCKRKYIGREIYCTRCASLLKIEPNRCSEMKTEMCKTARLNEKDKYCPYCASMTTYAAAESDGEW